MRPDRLAWVGVVLLLIWFARPPRAAARLATAHYDVWEAALRRVRRRPVRFRWWRFLLILVATLAIVGASLQPIVGRRDGAESLVICVDRSASMGARETDGSTAFARAVSLVNARLDALPGHIEVELALVGDRPRVVRGTRAELREALRDVEPAGSGLGWSWLEGLNDDPLRAAWVLTDGRGDVRLPDCELSIVGSDDLTNPAVRTASVDDRWPEVELTIDVELAGVEEGATPEFVVEPASLATIRSVERAGAGLQLVLERGTGGSGQLRLVEGGALTADDGVSLRLPPPPGAIGVFPIDTTDGYLMRAAKLLAELGGVDVVAAGPGQRVGIAFVDGGQLPRPFGGSWTFGTAFGAPPSANARSERCLDWDRTHELTGGLDWSSLICQRSVEAAALPDGEVLVEGPRGPLLVAAEDRSGGRSVHAAFRLSESNLPLLAAFPQLLQRVWRWTRGPTAQPEIGAVGIDPAESDLDRRAETSASSAPADLADPGWGLAVPLLGLAAAAILLRMFA